MSSLFTKSKWFFPYPLALSWSLIVSQDRNSTFQIIYFCHHCNHLRFDQKLLCEGCFTAQCGFPGAGAGQGRNTVHFLPMQNLPFLKPYTLILLYSSHPSDPLRNLSLGVAQLFGLRIHYLRLSTWDSSPTFYHSPIQPSLTLDCFL